MVSFCVSAFDVCFFGFIKFNLLYYSIMVKDTYTEISEKRTSSLGYLILAALFVFLFVIGQTVFSDIKQIPYRPDSPSFCVSLENIEDMTYKRSCSFNEIDRKYGLDVLYLKIEPDISRIVRLNRDISDKEQLLDSNERRMSGLVGEYDVSLQEVIAEEDALLNMSEIKSSITSLESSNEVLNSEIGQMTSERDLLIQKIKPDLDRLEVLYDEAKDDYKTQIAYYNVKVFILKLLFVLPFFGVFLFLYMKYKKRDSPYTIIITSIFFASTILFLQVVLVFLYEILPMEWFAQIFRALMSVSILKYLVYYGAVAVVIILLGGIVYYIQRKVYDPKRVAYRYLKDNKCPNCGFNLELAEVYCAKCGRQVKTKCSKCKNLKYVDLAYCPFCGKR